MNAVSHETGQREWGLVLCIVWYTTRPVCFLLLVLQGAEGVLQAVGEDLQLLRQLVLLTELLPQQHQVSRGIMQRDVAQIQATPRQVIQVHHTSKKRGQHPGHLGTGGEELVNQTYFIHGVL